ncbi:MAG: hypothetical protein PHI98_00150 [Eubacteriales bacterium]|nr:hypothetical protein [Eubacteriales bacterium]
MQSTSLILKNDGKNFEKMYYSAICLGVLSDAERLYAEYRKHPTATFWRDAFVKNEVSETLLMSAIINMLNIPFGSYMFKRRDNEIMEITPWIYGNEKNEEIVLKALDKDTVEIQDLKSLSRMFRVTAAFLEWLNDYEKKELKKKNG